MRITAAALALLILPGLWVGSVVHASFNDQSTAIGSVTAAEDFGDINPDYLVYLAALDTWINQEPANTATSVGSIEPCISVSVGEVFEIDVAIRSNIPPPPGISGFQYNLRFDGSIVEIVSANHEMLLAAGGPASLIDFSSALPANGNWLAAVADFSDFEEVGDGVLTRLTIHAIKPGLTDLFLEDILVVAVPVWPDEINFTGSWTTIQNATIAVGQPCPDTTPGPSATPAPTVSASTTPSPTTTATPTDGDGTPTPASPTSTPTPTGTPTATPDQATQRVGSPTLTTSPTPTPTTTPTPAPTSTVGGITSSPAPTPNLSGDAGCDGEVDLSDAIAILMYLGLDDPLGCPEAADVTCDNAITTDDLLALLRWRAGLPVSLPGGCPAIAST